MERRLAAIMVSDMAGFSRLIEADEEGTLARQKQHRKELLDPAIARYRGRIIKSTGDGLLVSFASAQDAVRCAMDIQAEIVPREKGIEPDRRIQYRIGINLGDVVFDEDDVFGDGVNVAARLEGLAEPGGVCISDVVHQVVADRMSEPFRDLGAQRVKNLSRPVRVWQWRPGDSLVAEVLEDVPAPHVQFVRSADGTHIAWTSTGTGIPLLRAPHWMNHLEYELKSPFLGPFLQKMTSQTRLVRFDQRGNGLSDWDVERINLDAMIEDMEAVVAASGLERFALLGISQGAACSIRYALKHPEQVSCLVLFGGYVRGRLTRRTEEEDKLYEAARIMIRDGWGSNLPMYRSFFTTSFLPDAPAEVQNNFDEVQRVSITPENAFRLYDMNARLDAEAEARQLRVPTLVIHITGDRVAPVAEGRHMARLIPGARFVELPGNHHIAIEGDPAFDSFFDVALPFLKEHGGL